MVSNPILDHLIFLIQGAKNENDRVLSQENGKPFSLWGCRYLLNQTLRELDFGEDHYIISKKAQETWSKITDQPIQNYHYETRVLFEKDAPLDVLVYKGNANEGTPRTLHKGDKFTYRSVFHDEHIVSIEVIIDHLLALPELTPDSVFTVINQIHLCRLLKGEDRLIGKKYDRDYDYRKVLSGLYREAGIEVVDRNGGEVIPNTAPSERPISFKDAASEIKDGLVIGLTTIRHVGEDRYPNYLAFHNRKAPCQIWPMSEESALEWDS